MRRSNYSYFYSVHVLGGYKLISAGIIMTVQHFFYLNDFTLQYHSRLCWLFEGHQMFKKTSAFTLYDPRREKTGLRGLRPGPTQTGLCSHIG